MIYVRILIIWILLGNLLLSSCRPALYDEAKTPEESLAGFELTEGFSIDIFATEPQVMDPVEMLFDGQGNIYVVEMPDYPFMPEPGQGTGRIVQLHDADQDGRIDDRTVFLDSITEATSILPWKDGFLITAAPYIYLISDTDNDGKADKKEIVFSGFFENNSEAQITNLKYNIDNWIYAANNGQSGEIIFHDATNQKKLNVAGADFRFRLDRGEFECASGPAQFGHAINLEGHRFITQNTLHLRHAVIPWRYLHRHNFLPSASVAVNISDHELEMFQRTPPPYWRAERTRRRQQQYKEQNLDRVEYAEDHFTGSSGGTFYAGAAFPEKYHQSVFTGDVAGNLVHQDVLVPLENSPTYLAKRASEELDREFLSSTDSWFRPANLTVGPDGYLYIIDMYRQHIETPLSIPEDLKEDMDFLNGDKMGRIYRIRPANSPIETTVPDLRKLSNIDLVTLLTHPNRWQRLNAQRLLIERRDSNVTPLLTETLSNSRSDAYARLHALYTLEGLNVLKWSNIERALSDADPGIREHGLMLAERYPEAKSLIATAITDPNPRVALQAVLSLGQFSDSDIVADLSHGLMQHTHDPWFRMAILSSHQGSSVAFLSHLIEQDFLENPDADKNVFIADLCYVIGHRNDAKEISSLIDLILDQNGEMVPGIEEEAVAAFLKGLLKNKQPVVPEALAIQINKMKTNTKWQTLMQEVSPLLDNK